VVGLAEDLDRAAGDADDVADGADQRRLAGLTVADDQFALAAADLKACSGNLPASCKNQTAVENTCCFISAGQLALTQFWDFDPATGPDDSWTLHGLWPDWCDGSYPSECDEKRAYTGIGDILSSGGADSVLTDMKTFWKDYKGDDETFWEHEWGKHGTCVSTLAPDCYNGYKPKEEVVPYFTKAVSLFKTLPTYKWLAEAGITPSTSKTYKLADVQAALKKNHGATVYIGCEGNAINEIWYHFNVQGSLQTGKFQAMEPSGIEDGGCPKSVKYTPKNGGGGGGNATHVVY